MALLRSEIQVACPGFLTVQQVVEQISDSFQDQRHTGPTTGHRRQQQRRLALRLPLDQQDELSDDGDEHDRSTGGSGGGGGDESPLSCSEDHHRSYIEISPSSDSAFHSEDFSPEQSRYDEGGGSGPVSTCTYCGSGSTSELGGRLSLKEDYYLLQSAASGHLLGSEFEGNCQHTRSPSQPAWWESNWSLHSEPGYSRTYLAPPSPIATLPSAKERFVPLVIPVPDRVMKPRIGSFDVDEMSELSEVHSIASLDSYSSADSESTLEDVSFLCELKDCRVGVGKTARFRCQILGRNAVTVSWHHGSKMVENGGRYRIYRHGAKHTLEIYFTTFADSGAVTCRAMGVDSVAETRARLRIRESRLPSRAPEFIYKLESLEVVKGDDVEVSCKVKGHPVPILTWFLNGRKLTGMDLGIEIEHLGKEEWLLLIEGKRLLSTSTIRCLASNPLGECVSSAAVSVVSRHELRPNVDVKLAKLDRKLSHTTKQLLDSAEEMLSDATQMASLDRQLKVVDTYLDRIEAKFRQTENHSPVWVGRPPAPSPPPQLSLIEVTFPSRPVTSPSRDAKVPSPSRGVKMPSPSPLPWSSDPHPSHSAVPKPQSVSITVLSKHVESDKVRVVFKQSFDSTDSNSTQTAKVPTSQTAEVSTSHSPSHSTRPVSSASMGRTYPEVTVTSPYVQSIPVENVNVVELNGDNLYSTRRLKEKENRVQSALLSRISLPVLEAPTVSPDVKLNYNRDCFVNNAKQDLQKTTPAVFFHAENTVNRTTDRLQHLDNRLDILQTELLTSTDYRPEDFKRLESAVSLTAAEISATERTIQQVESLVTHLQTQKQHKQHQKNHQKNHQQQKQNRRARGSPEEYVFPSSTLITYSTMTSTPVDFPQDGPSVKTLLSRFQNERHVAPDNGHRRVAGSTTSEENSDMSVTSSPDILDRKPLPVFNKQKFIDTVVEARKQHGKPRIQASITARSLSREMREQLRISRPQMGAFRSNIMTAENGEYDHDKALKAKELFIAESAHEHGLQDSQKAANRMEADKQAAAAAVAAVAAHPSNSPTNGNNGLLRHQHSNDDSSTGHQEASFDEGLDQSEHGDDVGKVSDDGHHHHQNGRQMDSSGSYDADSLDEESEHEPQYAQIVKQPTKSPSGEMLSSKSRSGSNGSMHAGVRDEEKDGHSVSGESTDSGAGLTSGGGGATGGGEVSPSQQQHEEDGDKIPLSQAPNWDLLI